MGDAVLMVVGEEDRGLIDEKNLLTGEVVLL